MRSVLPIAVVSAAILAVWNLAAIWLNAPWAQDHPQRAGVELSTS